MLAQYLALKRKILKQFVFGIVCLKVITEGNMCKDMNIPCTGKRGQEKLSEKQT